MENQNQRFLVEAGFRVLVDAYVTDDLLEADKLLSGQIYDAMHPEILEEALEMFGDKE
jgi:hypothetical protein